MKEEKKISEMTEKEILRQQLELLTENSKQCTYDLMIAMSKTILDIAMYLSLDKDNFVLEDGEKKVESEEKELFVRIPLENIKFKDSYEQSKTDQIASTNPDKVINYLEDAFKDRALTISFN